MIAFRKVSWKKFQVNNNCNESINEVASLISLLNFIINCYMYHRTITMKFSLFYLFERQKWLPITVEECNVIEGKYIILNTIYFYKFHFITIQWNLIIVNFEWRTNYMLLIKIGEVFFGMIGQWSYKLYPNNTLVLQVYQPINNWHQFIYGIVMQWQVKRRKRPF